MTCNSRCIHFHLHSLERKIIMGAVSGSSTWSRAQSSLMSHSGLSWPASMAGLTSEGRGLAKGACCLREKFFFWSLPSRRTFSMLAFSKRERGGMTVSPWPFFFFLAAAGQTHSSKDRDTKQTCKDASACIYSSKVFYNSFPKNTHLLWGFSGLKAEKNPSF